MAAAEAVQYLDALEIFTKGDIDRVRSIIPAWMAEYQSQSNQKTSPDGNKEKLISSCTPLHFAVQCPRKDVIAAILEFDNPQIPINAPDAQGMTALHLAAKASRKDVVKMLLRSGADDMLLDLQDHDPLAYAVEPDVAAIIQDHRSQLIYDTTLRLFGFVRAGDASAVDAFLLNPSEASRINLAARDSDTGGTILHLAVEHDMVALAKWAITEGVDVFARDSKSNMAEKYAASHQMKELLSQAPMGNARTTLSGKPPKFSGELSKWTNYAGGWKSRWFELEDGVLSYYKNKADADSSCRGAINLRIAKIMLAKEKTQFEVHGKGSIKYRLKAPDSAVAKQWVHLLNVSKQWALENHKKQQQQDEDGADASLGTKPQKADNPDGSSLVSAVPVSDNSQGRPRTSSLLRGKAPDSVSVKSVPHQHQALTPQYNPSHGRGASASSLTANSIVVPSSDGQAQQANHSPNSGLVITGNTEGTGGAGHQSGSSDNNASPAASIMSNESDDELYITRDAFFAALSDLRAQLFIQDRLLDGLNKSRNSKDNHAIDAEELTKYLDIASQTTIQSKALITNLDKGYRDTLIRWQTRLRKEQERIDMLADSLRTAVVSSQNLAESMRQQMKRSRPTVADISNTARDTPPALAAASTCASANGMVSGMQDLSLGNKPQQLTGDEIDGGTAAGRFAEDDSDADMEDDESDFADATDEFFDAVTNVVSINNSGVQSSAASARRARSTTGETPGAAENEQLESGASKETSPAAKSAEPEEAQAATKDLTALSGYSVPVHVRTGLPEIKKGGPSLNLWSVIKGAIGKDLSKISVPVFFNEPTSFLQRFTEDMEYCDLLEIATLMPRSEDRTLFVAGFAMSNYASTFGRIAKPFNPLLGETYEYVRRDKKYRALSEQVEHHPPISACWVEGKNYLYHADTNIKSKFNGGSLTVVPTGVCHVELKLPLAFLERDEERNAGKPIQDPKINKEEGYFTEHYTWNKLTTNVNGIMYANFWIEHVGDLDVKNHRTGDFTKITFVQSNWMGKNKFKVTGEARDRRDNVVYDIGGDWTSKLVAKPVNSASGQPSASQEAEYIARPANMDDTANAGDAVKYAASNTIEAPQKPFVLWKVNERQMEKNTYHLTTFAMSLNDRPPELEPFLCPTDSRFRPDQRAMETGEYDQADQEKSRLENKQRATRRRREQGELEQWKPRWFSKAYDDDSGEWYWRFTGDLAILAPPPLTMEIRPTRAENTLLLLELGQMLRNILI
ncbi:Oxysterol-binding protein-domain-containing protein [Coemansia spiralis]|nr:Oxysterol-binding protein-domain-containing protein [Coemansia spiralis]